MISLLSKIFIKDRNFNNPDVRIAYGTLCGSVGILLNLLLFSFKLFAGLISGSIAVTADAVNNLSDAGSSVISLIGFKMSGKKPDIHHPFGHGRIEYISGLIVSFFIVLMGFELGKSSVSKMFAPSAVDFSFVTIIILAVSIIVKLYMSFYNSSIAKKIDSASMRATATDSLSDAIATSAVLASAIFCKYTSINIDPYCGAIVALFIVIAGINAAKDTVSPLLGALPDKQLIDRIQRITDECPQIIGTHDIIVHDYGSGRLMISLHAEVDADGDILETHDAIDNIERKLQEELSCSATIHMDPIVINDPKLSELKDKIADYLNTLSPSLHFHDFRMVKGPTHNNIIFDIEIPYNEATSKDEIYDGITRLLQKEDSTYFAVINFDNIYS